MKLASRFRSFATALVHRSQLRAEIDEELRAHIKDRANHLERSGLSRTEAERQARLEFGGYQKFKEECRESRGTRFIESFLQDIRFALRMLRKSPGFTAVAVLSLALGIGATTAMFSLIYAVLLHPFPYAGADRIMNPLIIYPQYPDEYAYFTLSKAQLDEVRPAAAVDSVLGFRASHMEITGGALPEDILGIYLTENAGTFFGVRPLLGRNIEPFDAENGGRSVVVLNYRFWQRRFGGDPHVIGRTLEIDHASYTIVGVMPRSFAFNDIVGVADVYLPASLMRAVANGLAPSYLPWIKLRSHVTVAAANAALEPILREMKKQHSGAPAWHLGLQPIIEPYQQDLGRTLTLLLAGVVLLLIIGCANCSVLLLARGRTRQHELAIRTAIGASRWRIVRQLLVEALVISCTGAVLGVAASYWLARLPLVLSPDSFPAESFIRISAPILAFSVALALLCGILFGLVPALRLSSRNEPARTLPGRQGGSAATPAKHRWSVLIAAQLALTLLLMATAGTAIRGFLRLTQMPLGYDPANVMQIGISLHTYDPTEWSRLQSRDARVADIEQIRQKIASVPRVSTVAVGIGATPPDADVQSSFIIDGSGDGEQPQARVMRVGQRYFAALRIPLLQGRVWNADENSRGDFVAVVNHAFATRYLYSAAVGWQLRIPGLTARMRYEAVSAQSTAWRQIIGVVGDVRNDGVDQPVVPAIYIPYTAAMQDRVQFLVRTEGDPLTSLHSIRAAIASVASDQQISNRGGFNGTFTLNEAIESDAQYSRQRLFSILFGVFSAMALGLALVGIFSLVAYSVAQRTTEFGIRLALGAPRTHILWLAARIAIVSAAAGIAIGLALDSFLGIILAHWMQSTFATGSLFAAAALLALSALLACYIPARHAMKVDPMVALRYD